jgi:hypothetical protein
MAEREIDRPGERRILDDQKSAELGVHR